MNLGGVEEGRMNCVDVWCDLSVMEGKLNTVVCWWVGLVENSFMQKNNRKCLYKLIVKTN